ncbi:MAG: hypothetical protein WEC39_00715 [Patescibacteria group bacterium]
MAKVKSAKREKSVLIFPWYKTHWLHAGVLAVIFGLALWGFLRFQDAQIVQLYIAVVAVLAYVGWGALFHYFHKRLSLSILVEYLLVGALVLLMVFWLLAFS